MLTEAELVEGMEIAAKRGAKYNIEILNEELVPTLMILNNQNQIELAHIIGDNDTLHDSIKKCLVTQHAKAYALVIEAWSTSFTEKAIELNGRVRDMPLDDRFEVSNVIMVKRNQGIYKYLSARINTLDDGKRQLEEWEDGAIHETRICVTEW